MRHAVNLYTAWRICFSHRLQISSNVKNNKTQDFIECCAIVWHHIVSIFAYGNKKNHNMNANLLGRYVWLVDILMRHKRLTFDEISRLWQESSLNCGDPLPLRTFHNHQKAIKDIFDIYIDCDKKDGYRYFIDEPERLTGNNFRSWLISSYATLNQIKADRRLEGRIIYEDIPSGQTWLTPIADAMRRNRVLTITHQGFGRPEPTTFDIEPYCLKVVKRRWYVVARSPYYSGINKSKGRFPADVFRVYALDRITDLYENGETFNVNPGFDIDRYFEGCCGVITSDEPPVRVVVRAYGGFDDYLRTLPLHESQREIGSDGKGVLFEYRVKPTYDFYQIILAQGGQVEVVSPEDVRDDVAALVRNMAAYYKGKEE